MVKVSPLTRPLAWPFAHSRENLSVLVGGGGAGGRPLLLGGPSFCPRLKREPLSPPGREGPVKRRRQAHAGHSAGEPPLAAVQRISAGRGGWME